MGRTLDPWPVDAPQAEGRRHEGERPVLGGQELDLFINPESEGRPLLCEPRLSDEGGVRIRLWLRDLTGTGTGGAIALLSRDEAAVLANAIDTRRNWVGEKADDALPRIGVSATVDSTMIRFMECRGEGHIALTVTEAGRLASWLHDMADGRWRDHNGYVPEVVK